MCQQSNEAGGFGKEAESKAESEAEEAFWRLCEGKCKGKDYPGYGAYVQLGRYCGCLQYVCGEEAGNACGE